MNKLTWTDASVGFSTFAIKGHCFIPNIIVVCLLLLQVAQSLSKYCVLLHLQAASVDATNFSAICILSFFLSFMRQLFSSSCGRVDDSL